MPKTKETDFSPQEIKRLLWALRNQNNMTDLTRLTYILRNIPETRREKFAALIRELEVYDRDLLMTVLQNLYTTPEKQEERYEPQRQRLTALLGKATEWSVMVYLERPGDVACLISICPQLEGYEIVAASEDGSYDIWLNGNLEKFGLSLEETIAWLKQRLPPEAEIEANVVRWTERTLERLKLEQAPTPGGIQ